MTDSLSTLRAAGWEMLNILLRLGALIVLLVALGVTLSISALNWDTAVMTAVILSFIWEVLVGRTKTARPDYTSAYVADQLTYSALCFILALIVYGLAVW
ncbi:hypothetical protein [Deinococcus kurensis]|uniref:hypothetical protein n=1 Tax=Deinococcus kurensis TaxID=2662757 RepID=UPI0012D2DEC9|nr:hypothetical protein [Deinococcus kurensis]